MNRYWILAVLVGCSSTETPSSQRPENTSRPASVDLQVEDEPWIERWIGGASSEDCRRYIRPLLDRVGIPYLLRSKDLGLLEIGTDTAAHALEARMLILRDAKDKHYYFICRDGIVQPD